MTSPATTSDETSHYVAAAAELQGLDIKPEWVANVTRFFVVARDMAALVAASGALENAESAPVFTPRDAE